MSLLHKKSDHGFSRQVAMEKLKVACIKTAYLWFAGFRDACCLHRAYFFCRRSRKVFVKTGQCFLLNGFIFLGSIFFFQKVVVPILHWLLMFQLKEEQTAGSGEFFLGSLQKILIGICYVFWLYPLYIISFVINCIWYNEIAQQAFAVLELSDHTYVKEKQQQQQQLQQQQPQARRVLKANQRRASQGNGGMESILLSIGEQIYSVIMLSIFFIEVFAVSFIPYVGNYLNFLLLSWLYAYYCFDYRWGFAQWSLERRLLFFETNWAFFAGFGSPCVLATFFFSQFVSYGVMAILFPLFVLVATGSHPDTVVALYKGEDSHARLTRLPVFYLANVLMLMILRSFQGIAMYMSSRSKSTKQG